jgi:hypothetical protein
MKLELSSFPCIIILLQAIFASSFFGIRHSKYPYKSHPNSVKEIRKCNLLSMSGYIPPGKRVYEWDYASDKIMISRKRSRISQDGEKELTSSNPWK